MPQEFHRELCLLRARRATETRSPTSSGPFTLHLVSIFILYECPASGMMDCVKLSLFLPSRQSHCTQRPLVPQCP
jgi:hypothetical protein